VGLAGAAGIGAARPAGAAPAAVSDVAWWSRNPLAQAPQGGFQVGAAPDGPISVAAFHVGASGSVERATLVLTEAGGSSANQAGAALVACPTPNSFSGGAAQPYEKAPKAECGRAKAPLTRDPAGGTWSGDITGVVAAASSQPAAVMVVPDPSAPPGAFQIEFTPPGVDVVGGSSTSSEPSGFSSAASGSNSDIGSAAVTPSGSYGLSSSPVPPAAEAPPPAAVANPPNAVSAVQATVRPRSFIPTAGSRAAGGNLLAKGIVLVLIAGAIGTGAGFGRRYLVGATR